MSENQELMAKYIEILNSNQEAIEERMLCEKELKQVQDLGKQEIKKLKSENKSVMKEFDDIKEKGKKYKEQAKNYKDMLKKKILLLRLALL